MKSPNLFPVVGVGASAGGLSAFKALLEAIPEDSGMAFVLVQHLAPTHESLLPELLQKVTAIPVLEISDDIKVEPDHIYILPSNKMLVANDGLLQLSPRSSQKSELNLPIDLFFASLAEVHQSDAIGVVLSGTGSDGTKGLKAIKNHGGITLAQDEASAGYSGMPNSAVQAGVVDFVLLPAEMPQKLLEITSTINRGRDASLVAQTTDAIRQMLSLLRIRKGTDFTYYKQTTVRRRILRRMAINKLEQPADYLDYLRKNKPEQDALYQDLLIPVTEFFRDPETFAALCETAFPLIIQHKAAGQPIRIWVAGCSTGEEAYSLAICFTELLGNSREQVQLFASDLSERAIAKARTGIYTKADIEGVSPQRLQEFFKKTDGRYQVIKQVRDMCVFAHHNFLKDPPFGKIDVISCRNVLIYMEPYLQKKALTTFHYALNSKGLLLLGKSETISSVPDHFAAAAKTEKLFIRKDIPGRFMLLANGSSEQHVPAAKPKNEIMITDFQKKADDIILSKYTPAGVVVNEALDIVYFRGNTSNYLEQLSGKPTHNLLLMAKHGLAFELRSLLQKAKKEKVTVSKATISLSMNGLLRTASIEVIPLPNTIEPHYLVLFHETNSADTPPVTPGNQPTATKDEKDLRIQQLEQELSQTREDMRSITEDQEAVNEELQSANEELLSGSEELQSLNEEMETSKEELQSTNEELLVTNQEMTSLNVQATTARDYAEAIISNIREPLLVLDASLRIKTANQTFYKTFRVYEPEIEGVLIYELSHKQWDIPELRTLLEKLLPEKSAINDFELIHTFPNIGKRIMLLNAREILTEYSTQKFILLSIEDITERKEAQEVLLKSGEHFKNLVVGLPAAVYSCDAQGYILFYNDAAVKTWGRSPVLGKERWCGSWKLFKPDGSPLSAEDSPMAITIKEGRAILGEEIIIERPDGSRSTILVYPQPEFGLSGEVTGAINIGFDVTELLNATKKIEESEAKFRYLADFMPQKVWSADAEGNANYFNQTWLTYTGLTFADLKDWGWASVIHPDDWAGSKSRWQQSITTGIDFEVEHRIRNSEGDYKWHLSLGSAQKNENGTVQLWIGTNTEIHEQRKQKVALEKAVVQRTQELREANETLGERNVSLLRMNKELESFTYISSHDLQEPLRKIQALAGIVLATEHLTDKGKDSFQRMQIAAARMQQLIRDLLDFSRLDTAERTLDTVDLRLIIAEVVSELSETIDEKHATLDTTELGFAPVIVFQFRQLMHNLIGNALKFSNPAVQPHIRISCRVLTGSELNNERLVPEKTYCHIIFSDNGIGFDPQYSERIFQVFQRLHSREQYNGTGIGLAIVKKIVENHGGLITATGELNKGARFDIYLPARG